MQPLTRAHCRHCHIQVCDCHCSFNQYMCCASSTCNRIHSAAGIFVRTTACMVTACSPSAQMCLVCCELHSTLHACCSVFVEEREGFQNTCVNNYSPFVSTYAADPSASVLTTQEASQSSSFKIYAEYSRTIAAAHVCCTIYLNGLQCLANCARVLLYTASHRPLDVVDRRVLRVTRPRSVDMCVQASHECLRGISFLTI